MKTLLEMWEDSLLRLQILSFILDLEGLKDLDEPTGKGNVLTVRLFGDKERTIHD